MSINKQDVKHIAQLARIDLLDDEVEQFQNELGSILEYVDQLQSVDVEGVEPLRTISGARDSMRDDEHRDDGDRRPEGSDLIDQAPMTRDGYVETQGVFDASVDRS